MPNATAIDTDTGSDDAVALLMAARHPEATIEAVTTVAGNVPLPVATRNALLRLARERGPELTLVTLGPLTNIAAALIRDRHLLRRVRRTYCMAGAADACGNITVDTDGFERMLFAACRVTTAS